MKILHARLHNGLEIVADPQPEAHTAAAGFFVRTGSRDEPPAWMGVSHFLEHMVFKGTARRSAFEVNRDFDEIGANYNASTSQEETSYWAHVLPEFVPQAIDLLTDILRPSLRTADFDMEKQVILEEIGMYADRPFWVAYEEAGELSFAGHPLGHRVLGTGATVSALAPEQMREYFESHYGALNLVLALAGKIDFDVCCRQIEAACGEWHAGLRVNRGAAPAAPFTQKTLRKAGLGMAYLVGQIPAPAEQDDRREAAEVLATLLGDSDGSRLFWELVDPGLADEVELSYHGFDGAGQYMFYTSCEPERAAEVEEKILQVLAQAAENLTDAEVDRAANKLALGLALRCERPAGRMMDLGHQWLLNGAWRSPEEELARLRAVRARDVQQLLKDFPMHRSTRVRLQPEE